MKELYFAITMLCFIVAIMIYCLNKSIQALRQLYYTWKDYKQSQEKILDFLKEKNETR